MAFRKSIIIDPPDISDSMIVCTKFSGSKTTNRRLAIIVDIEFESDLGVDKFKILVESEWKTVSDTYINISNEWKEVSDSCVVVGGVWKY